MGKILLILAPIFAIILGGQIMHRLNLVNDQYIATSNRLIYYLFLPALLFVKISQSNFSSVFQLSLVLVMISTIIGVFIISALIGWAVGWPKPVRSTFINNNFRSNFVYIGLPIAFYAYGEIGLAVGSILTAFAVPLVNPLSVVAFSGSGEKSADLKYLLRETLLNPLIIAAVCGILFSLFHISLPKPLLEAFSMLGQVTLPLALFCIGASLRMSSFRSSGLILFGSSLIKLAVVPLIAWLLLKVFAVTMDASAKTLIILLAAPSAEINYVLASEMGGDSDLANAIIVLTTVLSLFSYVFWLQFLSIH